MIIISPKSNSLANQLFNIFAGIQYGLKYKIPFKIVWKSNIKNDHTDSMFKNLVVFKRNNWGEVTKEHPGNHPGGPDFVAVYRELRYIFNPLQESHPKHNFALMGYYHSYKYFYMKYRNILKLMKFDEIKNEVIEKHNNLDTNQDICMTFNSTIHKEKYIPNKEYYLDALKTILAGIKSGKFTEKKRERLTKERDSKRRLERLKVISNLEQDEEGMITIPKQEEIDNSEIVVDNKDDKKIYKILCCGYKNHEEMMDTVGFIKNHDLGVNLEFTFIDHETSDCDKLLLTTNCKYNIMSTNMLSWWSSFFCDVEDKEVYYPSRWYNMSLDTKDLFPLEWHKVMVEDEMIDVKESISMELSDNHETDEPGKVNKIIDVDKNLNLTIEEN